MVEVTRITDRRFFSLESSTHQTLARFKKREALDAEEFLAGFFALEKRHGAFGEAEFFSEEGAEFVVGATIQRGRVDFDFERVAEQAGDFRARGIWDGFDRERAGGGGHGISCG